MKLLKRWWQRRRRQAALKFERNRFLARLAVLAEDDPLWPEMLALLDATVLFESGESVTRGDSDAEAHRFRGRIGMLMDLRRDLQGAWREAHAQKKP